VLDLSELPRPVIRYGAGVWRRRWLVILVAWLAAGLGWFAISLLPDRYESQAHVFIQEALVDPLLKDIAANPNYERRVDVLRLSLLTYPNVEQMVYRAGLDASIEAVSALDRQAQLERLVREVSSTISIRSPRSMYFIISYGHSEPEVAKKIVDAAVNILIEEDLGASLRENESSEEKLRVSIDQLNDELTQQERDIAEYRRRHADELLVNLSNDQVTARKQAQLSDIVDNISQVRGRVETLRASLASTSRFSTGGELELLKVQLAQLRSQYNDSYPDIQNLLQQIERLESGEALPDNPAYVRLQTELQSANNRLRGLRNNEERLRTELASQSISQGQSPTVVAELQRLQRNFNETQSRLGRLLSARDSLALRKTLDGDGQGLDYDVKERPRTALIPSSPNRKLLIFAVIILALGAGSGLALVLTFIERTYTQSSDLEEAFGLPVLGAVGTVSTKARLRASIWDFSRLAAAGSAIFIIGYIYYYTAVLHPQELILKGESTKSVATIVKDVE